jgi:hypothetical protein
MLKPEPFPIPPTSSSYEIKIYEIKIKIFFSCQQHSTAQHSTAQHSSRMMFLLTLLVPVLVGKELEERLEKLERYREGILFLVAVAH